jgi:hypothetical protein
MFLALPLVRRLTCRFCPAAGAGSTVRAATVSVSRAIANFIKQSSRTGVSWNQWFLLPSGVDVIIWLWVRKAEPLVWLYIRSLKQFIIFYTYSYMKNCIFWDVTSCSLLKYNRRLEGIKHALPAACFMLASCLAYSTTMKMEAKYTFETSVDFQLLYILENRTLHNKRCEKLIFSKFFHVEMWCYSWNSWEPG